MQEMIAGMLDRWNLPDWGWNLILAGVSVLVGILMLILLAIVTKRKEDKVPRFSLFQSLVKHLGKPIALFLPLFVFNILLPAFKANPILVHKISKALQVSMIIVFAWILVRLIEVVKDWVVDRYDISQTNNLQARKIRTQLQYVGRILTAIICMVAVAMVLLSFENLKTVGSGLLTGVGLGGLIIGFAAQKSLANFLAGFQIAFTQPFRIDDVVIVEGEWGRVDEITLTYVVVKIWDDRRLVLPITYFIEKPFQNWTRMSAEMLGTAFLYVDHTIPVDELRMELKRIVQADPLWDGRVVGLQVTDITEKTMQLRALVSAENSGKLFELRCNVRERMLKLISERYPEHLPKFRTEIMDHEKDSAVAGTDPN